ncbi:non-heme ferritin [Candidatus Tachikawaea gelatinosa]|uniref:Ferritin n=1 Tax=Candidatus Tachikawaea gelatinosa TaxID=1410383 RepID=A0A090AJE7_9ENTR|nr:non-heme ferritin [Candidatus Tachikawaea gelatinosa]BAP58568.1 ferroxidase [Candidatus Tachikawaea gelatinosa]
MLKENIFVHLNEQLNLELFSANIYLQMSSWAHNKNYEGTGIFLKKQSLEEMNHMYKIFDYLNNTKTPPIINSIPSPKISCNSLYELFKKILKHEKYITKKINEITCLSMNNQDYSTFNFLQWYISEQREEENLFQKILDKINLIGDNEKNLFFIDKYLYSYKKNEI